MQISTHPFFCDHMSCSQQLLLQNWLRDQHVPNMQEYHLEGGDDNHDVGFDMGGSYRVEIVISKILK